MLLVGISIERTEELPEGQRVAMLARNGAAVVLMRSADITAESALALGRVLSLVSRRLLITGSD